MNCGKYFLIRLLSVWIAFVIIPGILFSQSTPLGGNLYGEPTNGSCTSSDGGSSIVSTPNAIYTGGNGLFGDFYTVLFKAPDGTHISKISLSTNTTLDKYKAILHVQMEDGMVFNLRLERETNDRKYPWELFDKKEFLSPQDSSTFKKLIGDAVYSLGTPWSQSSPLLWVSRDSMQTWQLDTSGLNGTKIQDINLDTAQYVYAATDNGLFIQNPDSNVWQKVGSFTQATSLSAVFVDRENRIAVAGSGNGLYLSTDNGSSWSTDASGLGSNQVGLIADDTYQNLYVTASPSMFSSGHIYESPGGTGAWQIADTSISRIVGNTSFQNMQINAISGDSVLVVGTSFGVFLSTDQGTTWTMNNTGIKAENISGIARTGSGKILLSSALGIFSNSPPDTTWSKTYPQNTYEGQLPLYTDGLGNIYTLDPQIFLLSGNGAETIVKSTDGGVNWSLDTVGLAAVNNGLFYVDETGGEHYGGGNQYFGTNPDLWTKPHNGSWTIDTMGFPTQSSNYVLSMTSDRNGYLYISGNLSGNKVMRRAIGGGSWTVDTAGISAGVSLFGSLVAGTNGDVYGTVGAFNYTGIMRRSGGSWSTVALPPEVGSSYVTAISVDTTEILFAAFVDNNNIGRGVYWTNDNGGSWTLSGLDSVNVSSLVSFGDSTYALTSTSGAFLVSSPSVPLPIQMASLKAVVKNSDVAIQWSTITETNDLGFNIERSILSPEITSVTNKSQLSQVWKTAGFVKGAGTSFAPRQYSFVDHNLPDGHFEYRIKQLDNNGSFRYSAIVKADVGLAPAVYSLDQNYPNPFNPTTMIKFSIAKLSIVNLKIYDLLGREVETLVDGPMEEGIHEVTFHATSLASGIYFYRLKAGTFTATKKLLLLK